MIARPAGPARHARVVLAGDGSLVGAVCRAMDGLGWASATLTIVAGKPVRGVPRARARAARAPGYR